MCCYLNMKINYSQLPIKAHYFFFMAAMGPIVPYLSVYGKQLGVSSVVIGSIVAILPIAYLIATIIFGYIADYFNTWRKAIFVTILVLTTVFYIFLYFLPSIPEPILSDHPFQNVSCESLQPCDESYYASKVASCNDTKILYVIGCARIQIFPHDYLFMQSKKNHIFVTAAANVELDKYIKRRLVFIRYVEDLAMMTGYMSEVKLIEGLIVAAAFLGSKIIFFFMAGKILRKFGYGYTLTFTFACYMIRLILISVVPTPWYIVLVEVILQGPSYALNYSTIVMYASIISPHGTSATVQGITAGMKEGVGYAIGGFTAGILYRKIGGRITLRIYAGLAGLCMLMFFVIYTLYLKQKILDTKHNVEWRKPDDAQRHCVVAET
ncbi:uncharacterized protein LOC105430126 [Pogonomyrmex barbatus]|uniref:Uncharacterized protein LOC105430126 n=1 Tax=Pogonomyrmex barbatus TaxID=144034 RepID=A0A8N1S9N3_9HYME|nr:uncharacterized protein LOC105430126 [Pogonomyrmex barbatus]